MHRLGALGALVALVGCSQEHSVTGLAADRAVALNASAAALTADAPGAVYALTNQASGNAVAIFDRGADGSLSWSSNVATGGTGGSNDVSAFQVTASGLSLTSRVASGGARPISLTVHGGVLYVLNSGGDGNISGFRVGTDGALSPIPGSTRALSGTNVGPAQVAFSPDGQRLVVTEKTTNRLDVYTVDGDGVASAATSTASAGGTPFGFSFGHRDELFVSEAAGTERQVRLYRERAGRLDLRLCDRQRRLDQLDRRRRPDGGCGRRQHRLGAERQQPLPVPARRRPQHQRLPDRGRWPSDGGRERRWLAGEYGRIGGAVGSIGARPRGAKE